MTIPKELLTAHPCGTLLPKPNVLDTVALTCLLFFLCVFTQPAHSEISASRGIPLTQTEIENVIVDAFTELKMNHQIIRRATNPNEMILTISSEQTASKISVGICYGYLAAKRVKPIEHQILVSKEDIGKDTTISRVTLSSEAKSDINGINVNQFIWDAIDKRIAIQTHETPSIINQTQ